MNNWVEGRYPGVLDAGLGVIGGLVFIEKGIGDTTWDMVGIDPNILI